MGSGAYLNPCCFGVHPINGAVAVAFVSILGAVGVLAFSFFTYFSWITYVYVAGCVIAFFNNLLLIYGVRYGTGPRYVRDVLCELSYMHPVRGSRSCSSRGW